jgi:hypothetical protein
MDNINNVIPIDFYEQSPSTSFENSIDYDYIKKQKNIDDALELFYQVSTKILPELPRLTPNNPTTNFEREADLDDYINMLIKLV